MPDDPRDPDLTDDEDELPERAPRPLRPPNPHDAGTRTSPKRVMREARQALALHLRKQGGTYAQIAQQLKAREGISKAYNEQAARRDVIAGLERLNADAELIAPYVMGLELERLDDLHAKIWPRALAGDWIAMDRVLAIMDRRARYLNLYGGTAAEKQAVIEAAKAAPQEMRVVIEVVRDRQALDAPAPRVIEAEVTEVETVHAG